ncbi:MAG: hypothetical protein COX57_11270 [Alphaproteobacteria bacterium CG_4_10_14_0_2_um_filter_63_37]|nr:MAG: hypothetical protein COX57_11270 [Alphaproteobacteria bacterium CG_4_10_14_0_2_um_filter_63_37]
MKRILTASTTALLVLAAASVQAAPVNYEYYHLYDSPRVSAMGGTGVAVGEESDALWTNPANLAEQPMQLELINPLVEVNDNLKLFANDLNNAANNPDPNLRTTETTKVVIAHQGELLHLRAAVTPTVAWDNFAVAAIGKAQVDAMVHNPFSSAGAVEINSSLDAGAIVGASFELTDGLRLGVAGKFLQRQWLHEAVTMAQLSDPNYDWSPGTTSETVTDSAFDVGLAYKLPFLTALNPKVAVSAMNITNLFDDQTRKIPMTVNAGVSIHPESWAADLVLAADYEDITNGYGDTSIAKRLHLGAELGLMGRHLLLRGGLNGGYPTAGAEVRFWIMTVAATYYQTELGGYAGQQVDTRYMVQATLGWK